MKSRTTWILVATVFIACWFFTGFNDLTPGYLAIEAPTGLGYGPMTAGKLMGIYQLFFMIGSIASGFVFEKLFRESAKATIGVAYLVSGALAFTIMLPAVAHHVPVLSAILPIIGFFAAWVMATALAYISIHYHHSVVGRVTGLAFASASTPAFRASSWAPSPSRPPATITRPSPSSAPSPSSEPS